jgi:branched-chain amino acid transport system substrate-binding protein
MQMPQNRGRIMRRLGAGLLLWLGVLAAAITGTATAADDGRTALIGFAGRLSDVLAQSARQGAELAVAEANQQRSDEADPIRFVLSAQNDQGNPNLALNVARYFVKSHVAGVIGHWSTEAALAVASTYEAAGIPQINFNSSSSQITRQGYKTTFRVVGSTDDLAIALADAAVDVLQGRRIAIIGNDSAYSVALSQALTGTLAARSARLTQRSTISAKTSDFNAVLKAATDSQADVIVFAAYVVQAPAFLKTVKRLNIKAKILLTSGASNQNFTAEDNGHFYVLEPAMAQEHCRAWKSFDQKFENTYGQPSSTYARYAYNATTTVIQAVRQSNATHGLSVTLALHKMQHFGLNGELRFDQAGNVVNPIYTLYHNKVPGWQPVWFFTAQERKAGKRTLCGKG